MQTGGAVLVEKGGKLLRHFVQTGPGDHLSNKEILQVCVFIFVYLVK